MNLQPLDYHPPDLPDMVDLSPELVNIDNGSVIEKEIIRPAEDYQYLTELYELPENTGVFFIGEDGYISRRSK